MKKNLLITGGAGFIGSNLSAFFYQKGYKISVFDNFARIGTRDNAAFLKQEYPGITFIKGDIRKYSDVRKAVLGADVIFHLAAQVAVTTSVTDPRTDFEINAIGSFNLLEAVRESGKKPIIIYASTNKVYGGMENISIVSQKSRYLYRDYPYGLSEKTGLDFHSPYGCSKGTADQYIHDYARIYGLPTVIFRQSCIYGPRQFGIEDQGWVAWFIIATAYDKSITVYGDGRQVRDILYIDDLVRLFDIAVDKIDVARGKIYNVGGGSGNTISVWREFGPILEKLFGRKLHPAFADWRPGDQKVYISDIRLVEKELGWKPEINVEKGIEKLYQWIIKNKVLFKKLFSH